MLDKKVMENWNFILCLIHRILIIIICSIIRILLRSINYIKNLFWQPKLGLYITARSGSKSLVLKKQVRSASQVLEILKKGLIRLWSYDWFRTLVYIILGILIIKIVIVVLHYFNICVSSELSYYIGWLINKLIRRIVPEAHAGTEETTQEEIRKHNLKIMKETSKGYEERVENWYQSILREVVEKSANYDRDELLTFIGDSYLEFWTKEIGDLEQSYECFLGADKKLLKEFVLDRNEFFVMFHTRVLRLVARVGTGPDNEKIFFYDLEDWLNLEKESIAKFKLKFDGEFFDYYCQINNSVYTTFSWTRFCNGVLEYNEKLANNLLIYRDQYHEMLSAFPFFKNIAESVEKLMVSNSAWVASVSSSSSTGVASSSSIDLLMEAALSRDEKAKAREEAKTASESVSSSSNYVAPESSSTSYVIPESVASSAWASSDLDSKSTIDESSVENRVLESVGTSASTYKARQRLVWELAKDIRSIREKEGYFTPMKKPSRLAGDKKFLNVGNFYSTELAKEIRSIREKDGYFTPMKKPSTSLTLGKVWGWIRSWAV